jgi:hypothetical protein
VTVVYVATPKGFRTGDAISVPPSVKAIEPVGVARPATPVTVKVKVTDWPKFEGLTLDVTVIVTGDLVTTCDSAAERAER